MIEYEWVARVKNCGLGVKLDFRMIPWGIWGSYMVSFKLGQLVQDRCFVGVKEVGPSLGRHWRIKIVL